MTNERGHAWETRRRTRSALCARSELPLFLSWFAVTRLKAPMAGHKIVAVEITGANEMADQDVAQKIFFKTVYVCACEARAWCVYVFVYLT